MRGAKPREETRRDREMLDYEDDSNLRWLVAAMMIVLGMTLVAVRYDDNPHGSVSPTITAQAR